MVVRFSFLPAESLLITDIHTYERTDKVVHGPRVVNPVGIDPNPDPTFKKKPDPDSTLEKHPGSGSDLISTPVSCFDSTPIVHI